MLLILLSFLNVNVFICVSLSLVSKYPGDPRSHRNDLCFHAEGESAELDSGPAIPSQGCIWAMVRASASCRKVCVLCESSGLRSERTPPSNTPSDRPGDFPPPWSWSWPQEPSRTGKEALPRDRHDHNRKSARPIFCDLKGRGQIRTSTRLPLQSEQLGEPDRGRGNPSQSESERRKRWASLVTLVMFVISRLQMESHLRQHDPLVHFVVDGKVFL